MSLCRRCNRPNDSPAPKFACSACGKSLLSKLYNLATVRLALTITGWVGIGIILSFMLYVFAMQDRPGSITIHNKRGGTATLSSFTFVAIGSVLLVGAGGILLGSNRVKRRISKLEDEYLQLTGEEAVYDITKPKPV